MIGEDKHGTRLWAFGLSVLMAAGQIQMPAYAAQMPEETQLSEETAALESELTGETEAAAEETEPETALMQESESETDILAEETSETVLEETEATESELAETEVSEETETFEEETDEEQLLLDAKGKNLTVGDNIKSNNLLASFLLVFFKDTDQMLIQETEQFEWAVGVKVFTAQIIGIIRKGKTVSRLIKGFLGIFMYGHVLDDIISHSLMLTVSQTLFRDHIHIFDH